MQPTSNPATITRSASAAAMMLARSLLQPLLLPLPIGCLASR